METDNPKSKSLHDRNGIFYHLRELQKMRHHHKSLMIAIIIFGGLGTLWILVIGDLLELFISSPIIYKQIQIYSGWLYVFITFIIMYEVKQQGEETTIFYRKNIQERNSWKAQMANKLQSGIENEEFTLFYQPQFKLNTGEIIGMEALIRWFHPEEGFISPAEFIPIAEETGQIYKVEQWVFNRALEQKKQWEEDGFRHLELSINLSAKTLASDIHFEKLETLLSTFSIDYSKISIEITETTAISNIDLVVRRLKNLKNRGLKIALDDFGTGYSSLIHLKELPIDAIKLDRSFIRLIPQEDMDTIIVKNILSMAHDLKYQVVAEGIETDEQLEYLKEYYCESGQGFLMSKPLPLEQVNELMKTPFKFQ